MTTKDNDSKPKTKTTGRGKTKTEADLTLDFKAPKSSSEPDAGKQDAALDTALDTALDASDKLSFEESIQELSSIVEKLEAGDLPLEQAVTLFEQGMAIIRTSQQQLQQATRKVEKLLAVYEDGSVRTEPFDA